MAPLIGLTGRRKPGSEIDGLPGILSTINVDVFFGLYTRAVADAGGIPVLLSADTPLDVVERLDGLVLSGGADVHPDSYGGERTDDFTALEPDRDAFEFALLDAGRADGLPILGVIACGYSVGGVDPAHTWLIARATERRAHRRV